MPIRKCISCLDGFALVWLLCAATASAKPNFTGTWVRDAARSDSFTAVIGPRTDVPAGVAFALYIHHDGKYLRVEAEQDGQKPRKTGYSLGGRWRGQTILLYEVGGIRYRSKWKGEMLIIERDAGFRGNYRGFRVRSNQEWELSPGGGMLTIRTVSSQNNASVVVTKEVFIRK